MILRMFSLLTFMNYLHQSRTNKDTVDYSIILLQTGYNYFLMTVKGQRSKRVFFPVPGYDITPLFKVVAEILNDSKEWDKVAYVEKYSYSVPC